MFLHQSFIVLTTPQCKKQFTFLKETIFSHYNQNDNLSLLNIVPYTKMCIEINLNLLKGRKLSVK